jgi:hypothetical protein
LEELGAIEEALHVQPKQLPTIEEAWLVHHLQDHKPRQMEDKDGVGQNIFLVLLQKVYRTMTCKAILKYGMELAK